jgi:flavin-dependent dehydrogenase
MVSRSGRTNELFGAAIIATGATSKLSQVLGIDGHPRKGLAFRGYAPKLGSRDALLFELSGGPTLQYRWVFPMGDKANVGACRLGECVPESKGAATAALRALAGGSGGIRLAGGVEPLWSGSASKWHHAGGVVSCGDCAGLVDPLTGEGITAAFVSGDMAACAVAGYLGGQGAVALEGFSLRIGEVFSAKYTSDRERDLLSLFSSFG